MIAASRLILGIELALPRHPQQHLKLGEHERKSEAELYQLVTRGRPAAVEKLVTVCPVDSRAPDDLRQFHVSLEAEPLQVI